MAVCPDCGWDGFDPNIHEPCDGRGSGPEPDWKDVIFDDDGTDGEPDWGLI